MISGPGLLGAAHASYDDGRIQVRQDALWFNVAVDGKLVAACVPVPTLQRVFGASPDDSRSWIGAYRRHAARINRAAIRKGRRQGCATLTLQDSDFDAA